MGRMISVNERDIQLLLEAVEYAINRCSGKDDGLAFFLKERLALVLTHIGTDSPKGPVSEIDYLLESLGGADERGGDSGDSSGC